MTRAKKKATLCLSSVPAAPTNPFPIDDRSADATPPRAGPSRNLSAAASRKSRCAALTQDSYPRSNRQPDKLALDRWSILLRGGGGDVDGGGGGWWLMSPLDSRSSACLGGPNGAPQIDH